ncbi:uncharacterized protein LOC129742798 [Uranotaenia lowii]|uniref:uncharacterized protein LOC129742798 n=1 Tax=Uranotaenia lowii TaxID=190385 RepID=UPI002479968F|nr:uncharacterized protein LOC129742798 [Uranotaenia lowii]
MEEEQVDIEPDTRVRGRLRRMESGVGLRNPSNDRQMYQLDAVEKRYPTTQPTISSHLPQSQSHFSQPPFERRHPRRIAGDSGLNPAVADCQSKQDDFRPPVYSVHGQFTPRHRSTPQYPAHRFMTGNVYGEADFESDLTNSQVAARKAVSQELPTFSGVPEEWPLFLSTYDTTTTMCRFTPEENLIRLQKCLRGKAYEAVKCMLMHPSNVASIISTLRMLFGSPEVIVHNLISKIHSTPSPREDRLETMVEFALKVKNLCATIYACRLDEYTYNVALIRELVAKLPMQYRVEWAKYRRSIGEANLTTFSDWLYDFAETILPITSFTEAEPKTVKSSRKGPAFLNTHSEYDDDQWIDSKDHMLHYHQNTELKEKQKQHFQAPAEVNRPCKVCKGNCTSLERCKRFGELTYNGRWAVINEYGLFHKFRSDDGRVDGEDGQVVTADCNAHYQNSNQAVFRVIPIFLYGPSKTVKTYAFLDDGSSLTLMESALAEELGVSGKAEPLCLRWTGHNTRNELDSQNLAVDISGTGAGHKSYHGVHKCNCNGTQDDALHQAMHEYFSIDGLGITKSTALVESNDDRRAREILERFRRRDDGRFEGRLLWKYDKFRLPNSKPHAMRRYECLEARMRKDNSLAIVLHAKMQDYISKGYIRKLDDDEIEKNSQRAWYLPIFPVVNPNKPNKIRIVWDAAAKSHGIALNSLLLKGPDQNTPLIDVLIRFREFRIAVCGDLREMFHQVMVSEEDQHYQRFLWKENRSDQTPSTYVMQVLTFGACCSPSIAQYAKNMNARDYAGRFPKAAAAIINNHYVDDMLLSVESEAEAIRLAEERSKWITPNASIKVDDVAVIVDPNLPRNCWPLGRVISAIPGKDGEVREVVVQTAKGIYERPAVKLAVLDVRRDV